MNKLLCQVSKKEGIEIFTEDAISFSDVDFCWGEIRAFYFDQNQKWCIGEQTAGSFFTSFIKKIKKVIDNKLELDESIVDNLGLMENQYCHDLPYFKVKFVMKLSSDGCSQFWVGQDYEIWRTYNGTSPMLVTWMYNDYQGNIVLEVTPLYRWSFLPDDVQDPEFITYDEFMKNYKPLFTRVIPRDVAIEWLAQAMKIYQGLFEDEKDFIRACNENNW